MLTPDTSWRVDAEMKEPLIDRPDASVASTERIWPMGRRGARMSCNNPTQSSRIGKSKEGLQPSLIPRTSVTSM